MERTNRAGRESIQFWERIAQEDPYTYILTSIKCSDPQEFWRSGERTVLQELLPLIRECGIRMRVGLELGCGVGRLVVPLSSYFRQMVGVDIAENMLKRARACARGKGIRNVEFVAVSAPEELLYKAGMYVSKVDFLYSLLVFQHIFDYSAIEGYLRIIRWLLAEDGVAYVQFDTREKGFSYRLKTSLPDFLLPRFWRRGIRRIRRTAEEIEMSFTKAGLEVVRELSPRTAYHRYVLRKKRSLAPAK